MPDHVQEPPTTENRRCDEPPGRRRPGIARTADRRPPPAGALLPVATSLLALAAAASPASAQATGRVTGTVVSAGTGEPVEGATVRVLETGLGALARGGGTFRITGVPPGRHRVEASAAGFRSEVEEVKVEAGETAEIRFELPVRPLEVGGIDVSVLRPDLRAQAGLEEREVREANPKDSGELLRELPGIDAVRRGPLGLDPSIRGLRETEVGTYLDGTRMFPAGPARMDSPLTHLDPSAVSDIQVVKGPYALTWGGGNLSAVRVETRPLPEADGVGGRLATGYDTNLDAAETAGTVSGRSGDVAYWVHGAWRDGDDYEAGGDPLAEVPGDYRSWEGRGKVGFDLAEGSRLVLSGGYQDQGPIDYPGRLLTARLFETLNLSGRWTLEREEGTLRAVEVMAYFNDVHHEMDNSGKPTAVPMPGRTPPFALDVFVDADVSVRGGRLDARLAPGGGWELEVGGDVYSAGRDAVRTIRRQEDGHLLFEDLMWPDATITDAGFFTRGSRQLGERVRASGTVRLDVVDASADSVSDFFRASTTGDTDATEASVSGALTLGVELSGHWTLSAGVGSAVRTADATERYSDRIPATKAQTSAEFMGNPGLEPERSSQVDLWLEGSYERLALQVNAFGRKVDDYITLAPTDLSRRLPLSPETVFRYVNGEATFWGLEASAMVGLTAGLTLEGGGAYLWGRDNLLDEPALGVHPLRGTLGLHWEEPAGGFFGEVTATAVDEMVADPGDPDRNQVALARGETGTDGYLTMDLRAGVRIHGGLGLRLGVENLWDEAYVNHLNAMDPFTGRQIPEPGRVLFADVTYEF